MNATSNATAAGLPQRLATTLMLTADAAGPSVERRLWPQATDADGGTLAVPRTVPMNGPGGGTLVLAWNDGRRQQACGRTWQALVVEMTGAAGHPRLGRSRTTDAGELFQNRLSALNFGPVSALYAPRHQPGSVGCAPVMHIELGCLLTENGRTGQNLHPR